MEGLTTSDVLAMRNEDGFGGSSWIWIILIILLLGGFNGNNNNSNNMNDEFIKRDIFNNQNSILATGAEGVKTTLQSGYDNTLATMQSRYDTLLGFKDAQYQQSQCCCEIKTQLAEQTNALATALHSEGEATRALITSNRIADLEYQLTQANTAVANAVQTQNILNSLGSYRPYVYGSCNCSSI